jgi:hypothetical protein
VGLSKLDELADKADDVISRELGASFRSIIDAAGSRNETEFMSLLSFSYQGFTKLSCINPNGTTRIQGRLIPNSLIASLGYYGRHVYFAFTGRHVDSLRQVYECMLKYPENGIFVFEQKYFSRDYRHEIVECDKKIMLHKIGGPTLDGYAALVDIRIKLILGKAEIEGLQLDEEGVILSYDRADIVDDLTNECSFLLRHLKNNA